MSIRASWVCRWAVWRAGRRLAGGGGGELGGEQGGAVVAEDVLVEEPGQGGHEGVFADGDGPVVGVGGGVAGVGGVVGAPVVDVDVAGGAGPPDAAHAALAGPAADPGPQEVPAAGLGGGRFGVADVAALRADRLGWSQVARSTSGGWTGSGDQIHWSGGTGRAWPLAVRVRP